mmetsp:Transcript_156559/g.502518  ORF Transcript_156559/g.502518 Transcript_156559/m.502518 type:complete len:216 (+) Transcript_156559:586-1233(+)
MLTCVAQELVHVRHLVLADALVQELLLQLGDGLITLVLQRVQQHESKPLEGSDFVALDHVHHRLEMLLPVVGAGDLLLQMGGVQQLVGLNEARQLVHHRDVLRHVARELAELRVLVDELLHGLDRLYLGGVFGLLLVILHILSNVIAQVAEVREDVLLEEWVLRRRHHDHLQLRPDVGHLAHVDSVVVHGQQLMQHSLICPLVQQRRHRIISPVE